MTARATQQFVIAFLACLQASLAYGQGPTDAEIEAAINEGVDLKFTAIQSVTGTTILKGGQTSQGDFLYLCDANLVWDMSSEDVVERFNSLVSSTAQIPSGFQEFLPMAELIEAGLKRQLGEFEAGDDVMSLRMRVRLESAGDDWIVTRLDTSATDFFKGNPLSSLKTDGDS